MDRRIGDLQTRQKHKSLLNSRKRCWMVKLCCTLVRSAMICMSSGHSRLAISALLLLGLGSSPSGWIWHKIEYNLSFSIMSGSRATTSSANHQSALLNSKRSFVSMTTVMLCMSKCDLYKSIVSCVSVMSSMSLIFSLKRLYRPSFSCSPMVFSFFCDCFQSPVADFCRKIPRFFTLCWSFFFATATLSFKFSRCWALTRRSSSCSNFCRRL
mmetsp:Transcript_120907/g.347350  ORF Transcript_120907/g.347350 Transcript_120907/m.347350 type:complete len:212 (-) Transcript_120907:1274-1909(-)